MRRLVLFAVMVGSLASGSGGRLHAQDVEMLGRRYGTTPPAGYFRELGRNPAAFRFQRGRAVRGPVDAAARISGDAGASGPAGAGGSGPAATPLGPRGGTVAGTFRIPVVLGLFSDSPASPPYGFDVVASSFFGATGLTIPAYYSEVSGGRLDLVGDVSDWVRSVKSQADATGGESGLVSGTVGPYIIDILGKIQGVDWGLYDNDGPDGVPNSGDDDGYVDVLSVIHPNKGGECGGTGKEDRIWSHRWSLTSAASQVFRTDTPAAGGGVILIDDYVVQPVLACNSVDLNAIGVFTHELGHAFGLPDLYDTDDTDGGRHAGAGEWDLMASGSWGCRGNDPATPCHMGAWSKLALGWVTEQVISPGTDMGTVTLPPVETSGSVLRVDASDGSGEYFLLENRQRIGFDQGLHAPGLLVWHIDPDWVSARWPINDVNIVSGHQGVWLRQADGLDQLSQIGGGRGDASDPFPYLGVDRQNVVFHASSVPASKSHQGTATGVTLLDIQRVGSDMTFHLTTRPTRVTLQTTGDAGSGGLLRVDGVGVPGVSHTFTAVPFTTRVVEAVPGEPLAAGVRTPFVSWVDDPAAPRVRPVAVGLADTAFTASYAGTQYQLAVTHTGGVNGVAPGLTVSNPVSDGLWFAPSTQATVEAVPTQGFTFLGWTGDLAGQANPATVVMDTPLFAGADYQVVYAMAVSDTVEFSAAEAPGVRFEAVNGTVPVYWSVISGRLPEGVVLGAGGTLSGASMEVGLFPLTVRAQDARGLTAEQAVALRVVDPALTLAQIASPLIQSGPALTANQRTFLDRRGNANGRYDLGDYRVWVLGHPAIPSGTASAAPVASAPGSERVISVVLEPARSPDASKKESR